MKYAFAEFFKYRFKRFLLFFLSIFAREDEHGSLTKQLFSICPKILKQMMVLCNKYF